jgi:glucosamine--fructose-6-phosphate aminotransferase (isomerizing)
VAAPGRSQPRPATLIAVTNDEASPLATAADVVIALHSGDEATVSTKSYLNSLAAHDLRAATLTGTVPDDVLAVAKVAEEFTGAGELEPLAAGLIAADHPRLAYIGFGDYAATALYAGLITKEGAKLAAEGYIGGQFRHGPLELAGPGLVAVLFGPDDPRRERVAAAAGGRPGAGPRPRHHPGHVRVRQQDHHHAVTRRRPGPVI